MLFRSPVGEMDRGHPGGPGCSAGSRISVPGEGSSGLRTVDAVAARSPGAFLTLPVSTVPWAAGEKRGQGRGRGIRQPGIGI